ncbi:hypothetical protein [Streptomyces sp. NPDC014734]|uniref:hypothetical protein n=1 Tax=Streptomyces sp. NPDC014734 TaxID=3364886 RepID=UPI0036F630C2
MTHVPHAGLGVLGTTNGFGADPTSRGFGVRVLATGDAGHSDCLAPHSVSLKSPARIACGAAQEATDA